MAKLGKIWDASASKERYQLARVKQAHVASLLLIWHAGQLSDMKSLVLNWHSSSSVRPRLVQGLCGLDFKV